MELSLDLSLDFVPKSKQSNLHDFVKRLEDEMRKIDAFKRELPLCVLLLQDAILGLKEEVLQGSSDEADGESEKDMKKKWMSSAQLWNSNLNFDEEISNQNSNMNSNGEEHWDCAKRRSAFELFKDQNNFVRTATKEDVAFSEDAKLTLMTQISDPFPVNFNVKKGKRKLRQHQQAIRKQRRCWSPELHRRFVDALHRLGGTQVATPKQIRELMQVEGLTNDEVKSHLQKYRLHVRKLSPAEEHGGGYLDSRTSVTHAESPDGPLRDGGCGKALSITLGESMEGDEDAKSDGHSWKGRI